MSYSMTLIHGSSLSLRSSASSGGCRKQRQNVVCCCPWSGSATRLAQNKSYGENTWKVNHAELSKINGGNNGNNPPFSLSLGPFSLTIKGWEKVESPRLPPGPSMLHLIGLLHYAVRSFPYHHPLRDLANTYGPLMHIKLGEVSTIVVSSADIAKEVLKTRDPACADRPKSISTQIISYDYTDIVLSPYGEYWKQMRSICISKFLNAENVQAFEYIRKDEGFVLVKYIQSTCGVPFNLSDKIFLFMNSTACRAVLGNLCIDRDEAIGVVKTVASLAGNVALADVFPSIKVFSFISWNKYRMLKMRRKVDKVLDKIIDDQRKNLSSMSELGNGELGNEDLVDILLRFKESDVLGFQITDDNIKSVISDMFGGGTESSSTLVDWTMAELMKNPSVMKKAQDEIRQTFKGKKTILESEIQMLKYLKLVIKETLRLHPPTAIITRVCREEVEIDGYHIPLNANVIVNNWAIGRDPNYWQNPESFEPERFGDNSIDFLGAHFEYIPFGAGKRFCPGMTFALANAESLLVQLLYHFDWKLPQGISPDGLDIYDRD